MNDAFTMMLTTLEEEIDYIFDNDISFLNQFAKGRYMDLTEVSFTANQVRISYILDNGQHVGDSITMCDYLAWRIKDLDEAEE